jgi:hypothetical protein
MTNEKRDGKEEVYNKCDVKMCIDELEYLY